MQFILVIERQQLFPRLSPQGFLDLDSIRLAELEGMAFFAEREAMEQCSHYKQLIPYIALEFDGRVLCYRRRAKHSERRLGGLWTVGFGGHVEPIDRTAPETRELGLLQTAAIRELYEETGLELGPEKLIPRGFINSEATEVSSVHLGLCYTADLASLGVSHEEIAEKVEAQAEPHRVEWRAAAELVDSEGRPTAAPGGGAWEDWSNIALTGLYARA